MTCSSVAITIRIGLLAIAFLVVGCASLTGQSQFVKIATDTDRADIADNGRPLGEAPGFVELKRSSSRQLTLSNGNETKPLNLNGRYRWGTSFLANALAGFIITPYGAVAGIAIDLLTGAAWDYDRAKRVDFYPNEILKPLLPRSISVAPPIYGNELTSDELARELYWAIHERYPKSQVYSYSDQLGVFAAYETNHESAVDNQFRDDLYRELRTTHIAISRAEQEGNKLVLNVKIVDLYRDQTVDAFQASIKTRDLVVPPNSLWTKTRGLLARLIPNSMGLESAAGPFGIWNPAYHVERSSSIGMFNSSYSLSLSNTVGRKVRPKFGFRVRLIPSITVNSEEFLVSYTPDTSRYEKRWSVFQMGAGIGPEVGLYTAMGYFYLNYVPELSNYWIQGPQQFEASAVTSKAELGYSFFMSDRLHFCLFGAVHSYPPEVFNSIVSYETPSQSIRSDVISPLFGVSLGYVFPEGRKQLTQLME